MISRIVYKNSVIGSALLFILSGVSFAVEQQSSIDETEKQCMSKNYSTAGMNNCTNAAQVQWDAEMNKYYTLLMKKLNKEEGLKLKEAQRAWIKYRDKEFEFINFRYFEAYEGTIYTNIAAADKLEIVKNRAVKLKEYYGIFSDQAS